MGKERHLRPHQVGVRRGTVALLSSEALHDEVRRNSSRERRMEAQTILSLAVTSIEAGEAITLRAQGLAGLGYGPFDALHLAAAESAGVDVLLTTDDRLLKRTARKLGNPRIPVRNLPVAIEAHVGLSATRI